MFMNDQWSLFYTLYMTSNSVHPTVLYTVYVYVRTYSTRTVRNWRSQVLLTASFVWEFKREQDISYQPYFIQVISTYCTNMSEEASENAMNPITKNSQSYKLVFLLNSVNNIIRSSLHIMIHDYHETYDCVCKFNMLRWMRHITLLENKIRRSLTSTHTNYMYCTS